MPLKYQLVVAPQRDKCCFDVMCWYWPCVFTTTVIILFLHQLNCFSLPNHSICLCQVSECPKSYFSWNSFGFIKQNLLIWSVWEICVLDAAKFWWYDLLLNSVVFRAVWLFSVLSTAVTNFTCFKNSFGLDKAQLIGKKHLKLTH